MPKLTIAAASIGAITSRDFQGMPGSRRSLAVQLVSGDAAWGWNADVDASGTSTAGIPLPAGQTLFMDSAISQFSGPLYFYSASGATLHYQELTRP